MTISKKTKLIISVFILVAIVQLWIPASMISKYSTIIEKGSVVKMKMSPRDPVHPFKGKYLKLNFKENGFSVDGEWNRKEKVFLHYHINSNGFLKVDSVSRDGGNKDNVMNARVEYFSKISKRLTVKYPFDKYFVEESKAIPSEQIVERFLSDSNSDNVYAEISILEGNPVLKEVFINDKPILEFIESEREND